MPLATFSKDTIAFDFVSEARTYMYLNGVLWFTGHQRGSVPTHREFSEKIMTWLEDELSRNPGQWVVVSDRVDVLRSQIVGIDKVGYSVAALCRKVG